MMNKCISIFNEIAELAIKNEDGYVISISLEVSSDERSAICEELISRGFITKVKYFGKKYISCQLTELGKEEYYLRKKRACKIQRKIIGMIAPNEKLYTIKELSTLLGDDEDIVIEAISGLGESIWRKVVDWPVDYNKDVIEYNLGTR